jgi:hypothetical protein
MIGFMPSQALRMFNIVNESDKRIDKIIISSGKTCIFEINNLAPRDSMNKTIDLLSEKCYKNCNGYCKGVFTIRAIRKKDTLVRSNFGYFDLGYPIHTTELFNVKISKDSIILKQSFLN